MTDFAYGSRSAASAQTFMLVALAATAKTIAATLREWRHRYVSRRELAMYAQSERSDLPFASEVDSEIAKPFWKA